MKSTSAAESRCCSAEVKTSQPAFGAAVEVSAAASIAVAVRVRPRLASEASEAEGAEVLEGRKVLLTNGKEGKEFVLDQAFDSQTSQSTIFTSFGESLVAHSLSGYNVCLFAYGHTGSGKTHTMMGEVAASKGELDGLLPRFLNALFQEHRISPEWHCSCEFFEVYNESIRDLLKPEAQRCCKIHVHPKHGVHVEGLTRQKVDSLANVLELVSLGNQQRTVAATTMNRQSSRSHAFFTFRYEQPASPRASQGGERAICFVDLAGREERERLAKQPKGEQYREMCFINTSLFHLAQLIKKLSSRQVEQGSLVDFRNSKITLLLSQALSGNCRTALMATLSPTQAAFEESLTTMSFVAAVKKIQTKAMVNSQPSSASLQELEEEVCRLQQALTSSEQDNIEKQNQLFAAHSWISYYKRSWEEAMMEKAQAVQVCPDKPSRVGAALAFPTLLKGNRSAAPAQLALPKLQLKVPSTMAGEGSWVSDGLQQPEWEPSPTKPLSEQQECHSTYRPDGSGWNWDRLAPDADTDPVLLLLASGSTCSADI